MGTMSINLPGEKLIQEPYKFFGRALRRQSSEPADIRKQDTEKKIKINRTGCSSTHVLKATHTSRPPLSLPISK